MSLEPAFAMIVGLVIAASGPRPGGVVGICFVVAAASAQRAPAPAPSPVPAEVG